jgi:hypothetical protein
MEGDLLVDVLTLASARCVRIGKNTPETHEAACDPALGPIVESVANSRYADDTLLIVTEDDVQDGPDHVDSHRGTAYVGGLLMFTRRQRLDRLRSTGGRRVHP